MSVEIDLLAPGGAAATVKEVQENPFCAGHAQLGDGHILLIGGENGTYTDSDSGETFLTDGKRGVRVYTACPEGQTSCTSSRWDMKTPISTERWYPTVATLGIFCAYFSYVL